MDARSLGMVWGKMDQRELQIVKLWVTRLGSSQYLKDLAISMPRRIQEVIEGT